MRIGKRHAHRHRRQRADHHIHISDRRHTGNRGKDNHKRGNDVLAQIGRNHGRKNQMQNVAAAGDLVARDRRICEQHRNHTQQPRRLVITRLEQIGNRVLGEVPRPRRDEVDEQQPGPPSATLPQRGETVIVGILRATQQRSRANPRREQREDQHKRRQRPARHQVVSLGFHFAHAGQRYGKQRKDDNPKNDCVQGHLCSGVSRKSTGANGPPEEIGGAPSFAPL